MRDGCGMWESGHVVNYTLSPSVQIPFGPGNETRGWLQSFCVVHGQQNLSQMSRGPPLQNRGWERDEVNLTPVH